MDDSKVTALALEVNLTPSRFLKIGGNVRLMRNEPYNPNIIGSAQKVHFPPNDEIVYILEPGIYVTEFVEFRPWHWSDPINYTLQQDKIMRLGAYLTLNLNPFMALLTLQHRLVLEEGLPIAKLIYWKE